MRTLETGTDLWGIEDGFTDAHGEWKDTPEDVREALRAAMGPEPSETQESPPAPAPRPCPAPPRAWGWAVQLYSLRSQGSWGVGDLADLRRLAQWSAARGAGFAMISPIGATQPVAPIEPSPYNASSRRFLSPLYLRIEDIPGADRLAEKWAPLAERGHALNAEPLIDRNAVFALKMEALGILWAGFKGSDDREPFARFAVEQGEGLRRFAIYCALAERFGTDWRAWPPAYRHPAAPAVSAFASEHAERIAFHQWIQWLLDLQLHAAALELPLVQDLPIGFDPGGADAWAWQDMLAFGASVGAPPDLFNACGQDWGLPPFIPHRLRASGYAPLRETIRSLLRHAAGLRIDHVMGLFHLYWIPKGRTPDQGAYVSFDHEEMLGVVADECRRAGAFAVGEDLGTVNPIVRERMRAWNVLGSKVVWFESDPPSHWPAGSFATVSTHDLPTLAGTLGGADDEEQRSLGQKPDSEARRKTLDRLREWTGFPASADKAAVAEALHRLLARSPASLVAASLEDALGVQRRPNLPGTTDERPNWRMPLPLTLEQMEKDRGMMAMAAALARGRDPG